MPYHATASPPNVLVVNDARDTLELIRSSLVRENYCVVTAINGREALKAATAVSLDAVISDVVMPELDGIELCAALRANPLTARIPILLMSAERTEAVDSIIGLSAGADDYLEVPFRQQELLIKIARLIERARLDRHYREIVEFSPNIIYTCDKNRRILNLNQAGVEFFGRTLDTARTLGEAELLLPHVLRVEDADPAALFEREKTVVQMQCAVSDSRTIELRRKPFLDNMGEIEGYHCVLQDFTERHNAEIALREGEQRYRTLYQDSPLMYFVLSHDGTVVSVNQTVEEKLGYAADELIGKPVLNVFLDHDRAAVVEQLNLLKQSASRVAQWEFRKIHKNNSIVYVSENVRRLEQTNGETLFLVICEDITERKAAAFALERTQKLFQTVVEKAAVVHIIVDRNGILTFSAGAALSKLNRRPGELVGRPVSEIWRKYPKLLADAERALAGESFSAVEELEGIFFKAYFSPLRNPAGELVGTVGVATDITQRVAAEKTAATVIEQLGEVVRREELTSRITNAIRQSLELEAVFQAVVKELGEHLQVDRSVLYLFNQQTGVAEPQAAYTGGGTKSVSLEQLELPLRYTAPLFEKMRQSGLLTFAEVAPDSLNPDIYENILKPRSVRSMMCVGIYVDDNLIGFTTFTTHFAVKNWSESDIALARRVAEQVGIAIRQAELYQKSETASRNEALINRISTAIRSSLQMPEVLTTATSKLGEVLDASQVYVNFYNPATPCAPVYPEYVYASPAHPQVPLPLPVSYCNEIGRRLLNQRQTLVINNLSEVAEAVKTEQRDYEVQGNEHRLSVKSVIFCPIVVNDNFRGTLFVEQVNRLRDWTADEVRLIEGVAAQLALGIAHAELFELMQRAKREWEATFDAMSDGVFIFDRNGSLVRVNHAGTVLENRVEARELLGAHCCSLVATEGVNDKECVVTRVLETGKSVTVERQSTRLKRPLLITSEPILDEKSRLTGVVCTTRDLYELRAAEAVAREQQSLLTSVLEGVLEPIFAVDEQGNLQWCNNATADIYRVGIADITKRRFVEMVHPEDRELALRALAASLEKSPQFYESRFITGSGAVRYAVFNSVPLVIENELKSVLWFVRDTTQQKIAVQQALQAEKLRALGQLASGVAHDFNNVLAAILGRVSLLQRQTRDRNVLQNLGIIQTAAEDAAQTVRRIQSFAKQSAIPEFTTVEVAALLRDSIELTRTRWETAARRQNLDYQINLDAGADFYVYGNASELREVFVNLIVNALDAMPNGGALRIRAHATAGNIVLTFADTGDGIAPDVRTRIFEPFFSTKGVNGSGLGLSVSYGIIEQHNGTIGVESEPGKGTTFTVALPATNLQQTKAVSVMVQPQKSGLSILIVDDEEFVREALMEMMAEFASQVGGAASGKQALDKLAEQRFDVVFTDFSMPEMDGLELAEKIHRSWSEIKTVLVTGYGKGVTIPPEKRDYIHAVIGKPFNFEQLSETLEKVTA